MGYNMFGPGLALDKTTMRGIPAVAAQLEDAETGETIQAYSMDDVPEPMAVVTNRYGYFEQFKVPDTVRRLRMRFGSLTLENTAWELIFESEASAEAAQYAAEAAAENVLVAQQAAERAAGLVGAPADLAIAAAINQEDSETRSALVTHFGDNATAALVDDVEAATALALGFAADDPDHPLGARVVAAGNSASDVAVAGHISSGTATRSALDAKIAQLIADTTASTRAAILALNPPGAWGAISLVSGSGWAVSGGSADTPQARVDGGRVQVMGQITNSSFTGGWTKIATLPSSVPPPPYTVTVQAGGNTTASRGLEIPKNTRDIMAYYGTASSAWLNLQVLSYRTAAL